MVITRPRGAATIAIAGREVDHAIGSHRNRPQATKRADEERLVP
jgi:hypothetical protein